MSKVKIYGSVIVPAILFFFFLSSSTALQARGIVVPGVDSVVYRANPPHPATSPTPVVITITQPSQLQVSVTPANPSICEGDPVTLAASAEGGTPNDPPTTYSYAWTLQDGSPATGLSATDIANPVASPTTTTTYKVTVTDKNGCTMDASVTVTVKPLPNATVSVATSVCESDASATTYSISGMDGATVTYKIDSGVEQDVLLTGGSATVAIPTTPGTHTITLVKVVKDGCEKTLGSSASVTVQKTTAITQENNFTIATCKGVAFTNPLSILAEGDNISYQWYSNSSNSGTGGTAISGETSATYTPPVDNAGTFYYYVVVSGTCGTVTSNVATVTVHPGVTLSTSMKNVSCYGGDDAEITVTVDSGTSPYIMKLTQTSADPSTEPMMSPNPLEVNGATSPYTFTGLKAGTYQVVVTDSKGCNNGE